MNCCSPQRCRSCKKISNTLKLSYSTVVRVIQRFSETGSTRGTDLTRVHQKSRVLVLCVRCRSCFKKQTHECCSIALEVVEAEGLLVSAQTVRRTPQQVGLQAVVPKGASSEAAYKKKRKQFAEDDLSKSMNYWNHVLWSDETKINMFGSDGVQHVWGHPGEKHQENLVLPTVKPGGGNIMVWGCMSAAGTVELRFIEENMDSNMYCDVLKQNTMLFLQKLGPNDTFPT